MKLNLMIALVVTVVFSGCVSVQYPTAHDKSFPPDGRYEILGSVIFSSKVVSILDIFAFGGAKYEDLYNKAKAEYGADDVVNVSVDSDLKIFFLLAWTIEYTLRGTAIRYLPAAAPAE